MFPPLDQLPDFIVVSEKKKFQLGRMGEKQEGQTVIQSDSAFIDAFSNETPDLTRKNPSFAPKIPLDLNAIPRRYEVFGAIDTVGLSLCNVRRSDF
ncbi:MAG: hypothetical protein IZT59_01025 [Verrucomicrobia bacterium]|nr:hypothetical protein [Verrucomicrobiota bacterium]